MLLFWVDFGYLGLIILFVFWGACFCVDVFRVCGTGETNTFGVGLVDLLYGLSRLLRGLIFDVDGLLTWMFHLDILVLWVCLLTVVGWLHLDLILGFQCGLLLWVIRFVCRVACLFAWGG